MTLISNASQILQQNFNSISWCSSISHFNLALSPLFFLLKMSPMGLNSDMLLYGNSGYSVREKREKPLTWPPFFPQFLTRFWALASIGNEIGQIRRQTYHSYVIELVSKQKDLNIGKSKTTQRFYNSAILWNVQISP